MNLDSRIFSAHAIDKIRHQVFSDRVLDDGKQSGLFLGFQLVGTANDAVQLAACCRGDAERLIDRLENELPSSAALITKNLNPFASGRDRDRRAFRGVTSQHQLDGAAKPKKPKEKSVSGRKRRRNSLRVKDPALREIMRDRAYTQSSLQHDTGDDHTELLFTI